MRPGWRCAGAPTITRISCEVVGTSPKARRTRRRAQETATQQTPWPGSALGPSDREQPWRAKPGVLVRRDGPSRPSGPQRTPAGSRWTPPNPGSKQGCAAFRAAHQRMDRRSRGFTKCLTSARRRGTVRPLDGRRRRETVARAERGNMSARAAPWPSSPGIPITFHPASPRNL